MGMYVYMYMCVRTCIPACVHEYVCVEVHLCTGMWHEHHFSGVISLIDLELT